MTVSVYLLFSEEVFKVGTAFDLKGRWRKLRGNQYFHPEKTIQFIVRDQAQAQVLETEILHQFQDYRVHVDGLKNGSGATEYLLMASASEVVRFASEKSYVQAVERGVTWNIRRSTPPAKLTYRRYAPMSGSKRNAAYRQRRYSEGEQFITVRVDRETMAMIRQRMTETGCQIGQVIDEVFSRLE